MSKINIEANFEVIGGVVDVTLNDRTAYVTFRQGQETVVIEDSSGETTDWFSLYQKKWALLSGAALNSAELKFAREYGENAMAQWIILTAGRLAEEAAA